MRSATTAGAPATNKSVVYLRRFSIQLARSITPSIFPRNGGRYFGKKIFLKLKNVIIWVKLPPSRISISVYGAKPFTIYFGISTYPLVFLLIPIYPFLSYLIKGIVRTAAMRAFFIPNYVISKSAKWTHYNLHLAH
jgi:hypothetical protein